jgi:hypothetical protein
MLDEERQKGERLRSTWIDWGFVVFGILCFRLL